LQQNNLLSARYRQADLLFSPSSCNYSTIPTLKEESAEAATVSVPAPQASEKVRKLAEEILALNLIEAKDLADALKDGLGIPKDQPMGMPMGMPMMAAAAAPAAAAPAEEEAPKEAEPEEPEKTEFDLKLEKFDEANKIKIIKEIRSATNLPLKEAKDVLDKCPSTIKKKVPKEEAEKIKAAIEALGGVVKMV
jgi:large subunit ribosomal protein L7/L12